VCTSADYVVETLEVKLRWGKGRLYVPSDCYGNGPLLVLRHKGEQTKLEVTEEAVWVVLPWLRSLVWVK